MAERAGEMRAIAARSIAEVLGIKARSSAFTSLDLAQEVAKGLPVVAIDRVCGTIAPSEPGLRHRIVAKATLARRYRSPKRRLSPEESDRLARLARLWALAVDVWGTAAAARRFLLEPYVLLGGRIPLEVVMETEIGARTVEELLGRLKYGSAA